MGVETKASKTAYHLYQCQEGTQVNDEGYRIQMPDGRTVPQAMETYRLLGTDMDASVGHTVSRETYVQRGRTNIGVTGAIGGMSRSLAGRIWESHMASLSLTFGGPTPIGWEGSEDIEKTKRRSLARMGERASRGPRAQVYVSEAEGGMGQTHTVAFAMAATILHVNKGLGAPPLQPHRTAIQHQIALAAWRYGWYPTEEQRTPLEWLPIHGMESANDKYLVGAWWKALWKAGIRVQHTGSNRGSREALDPDNKLYEKTCDGGGASLWHARHKVNLELSQVGIVRAIDIYKGKGADGTGEWRAWKDVRKYYLRGEYSQGQLTRMRTW